MEKTREQIQLEHEKLAQQGLKDILNSVAGRAWLFDLISRCGVYTADPIDEKGMYFSAGKRNVGLQLLGEAGQIDNDGFLKMLIEDINRKKEIENGNSTNTNTSNGSGIERTKFNAIN